MERIFFTSSGNGQKYQLFGWSEPENEGTWSDGDTAIVLLNLSTTTNRDLELLVEGHAFLGVKHSAQEIEVLVNKRKLSILKYDSLSDTLRKVMIPMELVNEKKGRLLIQFKFKNPKSPAELGLSNDSRRLGLMITSMQLKLAEF